MEWYNGIKAYIEPGRMPESRLISGKMIPISGRLIFIAVSITRRFSYEKDRRILS
jgi:hypothetical protein